MRGLHVAAYFGIVEATKDLLNSSNNLDMKDDYSRTPLSLAAENGHEAVVKILLATEKVKVNSKDI
jgi:ankyrin repeat protein